MSCEFGKDLYVVLTMVLNPHSLVSLLPVSARALLNLF